MDFSNTLAGFLSAGRSESWFDETVRLDPGDSVEVTCYGNPVFFRTATEATALRIRLDAKTLRSWGCPNE